MARPAGIIDSAPKRSSEARVCIESTTPTAMPETAISGAERRPSSKSWRTVSRNSNGGERLAGGAPREDGQVANRRQRRHHQRHEPVEHAG